MDKISKYLFKVSFTPNILPQQEDAWLGHTPLKQKFPDLFRLVEQLKKLLPNVDQDVSGLLFLEETALTGK